MKFIIVVHNWFMESEGFEVHEIEAENEDDAYKQGLVIKTKGENTFNRRAIVVVAFPTEKECYPRIVKKPSILSRLLSVIG